MRRCVFLVLVALLCGPSSGCTSGGDDDTTGSYELWTNDDYLGVIELTFLKGRCVGRANIDSQAAEAETALLAFGRFVAAEVPLDGSSPADDDQLVALVPVSPLSGDLAVWDSSQGGAWLITTSAFDWIDGSGPPFEDNGFEAVAGDTYTDTGDGWELDLELVDMGSVTGAEAAFRAAGWDTGNQRD